MPDNALPYLTPVDHDPFVTYTPVDHDPFENVPGIGMVPSSVSQAVASMVRSAGNLVMAPGNVARGQQPSVPGQWSDLDEARAQMNAQGQYQWGPAMASNMLMAPGLTGGVPGLGSGIRAFHGSPYDFDKFSSANIGTGEGAQAYGHGLYFAENPAVAEQYKIDLPNKIVAHPDDLPGAKMIPGKMYEVNINADPSQFLDWDKPINEQSQFVQDALGRAGIKTTGIDKLSYPPSAAQTVKLHEAGIPGIKYLDQGSRVGGRGTSNYVVFDDKLIDIIKKYGVAGLIAGGVAHFSTAPVDHDPFK